MGSVPKPLVVAPIASAVGQWLQFPDSMLAPSPQDRTKLCKLKIAQNDVRKLARAGRRQAAFELWSIVLGQIPPVPGVERRNTPHPDDLTSLRDAHACFRGIKRPLAEDDNGDHVFAYILRPHFLYEYDPSMVSVASKVPVPRNVVFVTYVRFNRQFSEGISEPQGTVTHWGFVESDPKALFLPVNYASRYRTKMW
jgi:hypothetical protein